VADDAIYDARSICMREYGDAPEVSVYGDPRFTFAYVPSHLHHMVRMAYRLPFASDTALTLHAPIHRTKSTW